MALPAPEVQDRSDLAAYLTSHMSSEYRDVSTDGGISQHTTYIKSYILECHDIEDTLSRPVLSEYFAHIHECSDPTLRYLATAEGEDFFLDSADSRFVMLHSVAKASVTDRVVAQLSTNEDSPFDRAWFPSNLLLTQKTGPLRSFQFTHVRALLGTSNPDTVLDSSPPSWLTDAHRKAIATLSDSIPDPIDLVAVPTDELDSLLPLGTRSRLSITNSITSDFDLHNLLSSSIFSGRKALESIDFVTQLPATVSDTTPYSVTLATYSNGKLVGNGNSVSLYLLLTANIRRRYQRAIESIESEFGFAWTEVNGHFQRKGTPIHFQFPGTLIEDLQAFASSLCDSQKPFRLFGIPHKISEDRIDIEALDLHTMDPLSLEVTKNWMRLYLPEGSCGNVVARLLTNLQHSAHSDIQAYSPLTGEAVLAGTLADGE